MELQLRKFKKEDYKTILNWWKFWKFSAVPFDFLPETGYMLTYNGEDVIAGFLYKTNSKVCWIEFIVSNPKIKDRSLRKSSKIHLISILSEMAKDYDFKYIYANLKDKHLINTYLQCGFTTGDSGYQEVVKTL